MQQPHARLLVLEVQVFGDGLDDHLRGSEVALPEVTLVGERDHPGPHGIHLPIEATQQRDARKRGRKRRQTGMTADRERGKRGDVNGVSRKCIRDQRWSRRGESRICCRCCPKVCSTAGENTLVSCFLQRSLCGAVSRCVTRLNNISTSRHRPSRGKTEHANSTKAKSRLECPLLGNPPPSQQTHSL